MSEIMGEIKRFEEQLEHWKQVHRQGGSIEPYDLIVSAIRVSSVVLEEYPRLMQEQDALRARAEKAEAKLAKLLEACNDALRALNEGLWSWEIYDNLKEAMVEVQQA